MYRAAKKDGKKYNGQRLVPHNATQWHMENRSFARDLNYGKMGEDYIKRYLESKKNVREVIDISNTKMGVKDDVDFEVVYTDGHSRFMEVKTDNKAHRTGNIVFEKISNGKPGCFARTTADYILYYIIQEDRLLVIKPDKFRAFIERIENDADLMRRMKIRAANMGEREFGFIIPIASIINEDFVECDIRNMFNGRIAA